MENLGPLNFLRIPLSNLWDTPDIREWIARGDVEFERRTQRWYCRYGLENRIAMRTQLEWALQNPTYDFKNLLINVKTSNEDILLYFGFLLNLIGEGDCPGDVVTRPVEGA